MFGSSQSDQFKSHTHTVRMDSDVNGVIPWSNSKAVSTSLGNLPANAGTAQIDAAGGTETRPRNVALLPCIKAVPDYNNYAANQLVESFTVTSSSQSVFTTTTVDTRVAYIFVDGIYQPPTEYITATSSSLQFNSPIYKESTVDVVKVYAASTAPASKSQMVAATDNTVMVTPSNFKDSPFSIKAWANCSSAGALNGGRGLTVLKVGTGQYRFTLASPFSNTNYVTVVTAEQPSEGDSRICEYVYGKTNSQFYVNTQTAGGTNTDKQLNVIVVGV